ncbi:MAG: TldD/PmbA family protein [Candidatus Diapherotrites archaeon]
MKASIEELDSAKDALSKALSSFAEKNKKLRYADVRLELGEGKGASALQGNVKGASEDYSVGLGVRVFAGEKNAVAGGFAGKTLGLEDLRKKLGKNLNELLGLSLKRALLNSTEKQRLAKKFPAYARGIHSTELAPVEVCVETVKAEFKKNPRDASLEELIERVEKVSKQLQQMNGIATNSIGVLSGLNRKIFGSTEGALIDQTFALTEAFIFLAAKGKAMETYNEILGDYSGLEVLDGVNPFGKNLEDFSQFLADGTVEVSNAPAMKRTAKEETVITDPWFNTLLSHEVTGHPSEADRALKKEAAWAGRAWWFTSLEKNWFGKKVGSDQLTVFSDPSLKGFGGYKYDDEGVKAKKIFNIKNGVLNEFLNSRETALILGKEPNGGMRASSAEMMPIIRMNNTCIAPGEWKKDELFADTKEGWYAVGQKTPSIGETRQNFTITCWKLYKIENGEPTQLYRSGGISSDSHKFFLSIDAVADDFHLFNVPNCGKGTPMQTMRVGNGGPHLRGKAIVSGAMQ